MRPGAQLSIAELRTSTRFAVNHEVMADHCTLGEVPMAIVNISMVGFMVNARGGIERGERLLLKLPEFGRLEALCIWTRFQQAGFLFERPIPSDKFERVVADMKDARASSMVIKVDSQGMSAKV